METELLRVDTVNVHFGGLRAVSDVSFAVARGEVFGIVGPNGAGKTTLLNTVSGLVRVSSGSIHFEESRIDRLRPHEITALGIGRTFQNAQFFSEFTARSYVALGLFPQEHLGMFSAALATRRARQLEAVQKEKADEALGRLGIQEVTDVALRELPYGIQRLVDLARAMASAPTLLLLDEPTSGTVRAERQRIVEVMQDLRASGTTVLVIDHDVDFVRRCCHRMLVMSYGSPLGIGEPTDVLEREEVKHAYLGAAVVGEVAGTPSE